MRRISLLAAASLAWCAPAMAQMNAWAPSKKAITHLASGVSFSLAPGGFTFDHIITISHPHSGLDTVAQWFNKSKNGAITISVSLPTLGDEGLAAIATDLTARSLFGANAKAERDGIVAAGSLKSAARRIDYAPTIVGNKTLWTSVAVLKSGNWIVKIRAAGLATDRKQLSGAMDSILKEIKFSAGNAPLPFHAITLNPCATPATDTAANVTSSDVTKMMSQLVVIKGVDFGVSDDKGKRIPFRRVPDRLCLGENIPIGGTNLTILRPDAGSRGKLTDLGLIALVGDQGTMIEASRMGAGDMMVIIHGVGDATVLPFFDAVPSNTQLVSILTERKPPFDKPLAVYQIDAQSKVLLLPLSMPEKKPGDDLFPK